MSCESPMPFQTSFVLPLETYEDDKYNRLRRAYLLLIASLIEAHLIDEDINNYVNMIMAIEQSCYDDAVKTAEYELMIPDFAIEKFEYLYRTKIVRITKNLDINSEVGDDYLITALLDGHIDPLTISSLTPEELSPSRNAKILETIDARRSQKATQKVSTLYRCRQCGKRECTVRSVQMRSLDEGETLIIQCVFCSYKWFI